MRQNITLKEHLREMRDLFKNTKKTASRPDRIENIIEIYRDEIKVAK